MKLNAKRVREISENTTRALILISVRVYHILCTNKKRG